MITGAIAIIMLIAAGIAGANGKWESAAVGVVIAIFMLALGAAGRETFRAYTNFVSYWASGGPERKRQIRMQIRKEIREDREMGKHTGAKSQEQSFVCHYCGRFVRAVCDVAYTEEGRVRVYRCPKCGRQNMTKV